MSIPTDEQIERARNELPKGAYGTGSYSGKYPSENACVRIAYVFLSLQIPGRRNPTGSYGLKHIIENWAGRYMSKDDVLLAAHLLGLKIRGADIFITHHRVRPSPSRIAHLDDAYSHSYTEDMFYYSPYKSIEIDVGNGYVILKVGKQVWNFVQAEKPGEISNE